MDLQRAITKLFSAQILLAVIEFIAIAYFTRRLGTGAIGSFFLYQAVIGIVAIGSNLGVSKAAEQAISSNEDSAEVMTTAILLQILLMIPFIISIIALQSQFESYIGLNGASYLLAVGLVTTLARRTTIRFLAGQMQVAKTANLRVIGKIVWVATGVVLITTGFGAHAVIIGFIIGDIASIFTGLFYLDFTVGLPTVNRAQSLLRFGYYVVLRSSGSYIYGWMDVVILGFFVPASAVGAYEIAWRVAAVGLMLTKAIRESIFPKISELYEKGNINEIRSILFRWIQPTVYLTIPGFFGALVIGDRVLGVPFGEEAIIAVPVLIIFMAEKVFRTGHLLFSATIYAIDQPELGYRAEVVSLGFNLVLNLALIPLFGIIGAAIATTISSVIAALINGYYVNDLIGFSLPKLRFGWSVLSSALMAGGIYAVNPVLPSGPIGLILGVLGGATLYSIFMFMNPVIRREVVLT